RTRERSSTRSSRRASRRPRTCRTSPSIRWTWTERLAGAERTGPLLTGALLKGVSRSFYLSLAVLPREIRPTVGLAYLFARAADTIADTRLLPRAQRLTHLTTFRDELDASGPGARGRARPPRAAARLLRRLSRAAARRRRSGAPGAGHHRPGDARGPHPIP